MKLAKDPVLEYIDALSLGALDIVFKLSGGLWIDTEECPPGSSMEARYWYDIQDRLDVMYCVTAKEKKWKRYAPLKDLLC